MNGMNSGNAAQMSEDDYDDYKRSPGHSASGYYPGVGGGSGLPSTGGNPSSSGGGNPGGSGGGGGGGGYSSSMGGAQGPGSSSRNQICCLTDDGKRCTKFAGNASYSRRIQKTVYFRKLKLDNDRTANHIYICDYHKIVIQNARSRQKKDSDDEMNDGDDAPDVDLYQLQVNTLRRYKKHFKIPSRPGLNKAQLADILMRHFKTIPVNEKEVVTYFIYMIKSEKNKLDNNNRTEGGAGGAEFTDRY